MSWKRIYPINKIFILIVLEWIVFDVINASFYLAQILNQHLGSRTEYNFWRFHLFSFILKSKKYFLV